MNEWIYSVLGGILTVILGAIGGGVAIWLKLKGGMQTLKEKSDLAEANLAKEKRNGLVAEMQATVNFLGGRVETLEKQVTALYAENSELRKLVTAKDVRVEKQATRVDELQATVVAVQAAVGPEVKPP